VAHRHPVKHYGRASFTQHSAYAFAVGTLEEFRATFWTVLGTPKGRRSKRYYDVWADLYLIPDALAGPLYAIYKRGECDYVFSDPARFPTIHDPDTFLAWCLALADEYRNGVLIAGARDEDEKADQAALLERANGMERLSRMAYEIVKERWGSNTRK